MPKFSYKLVTKENRIQEGTHSAITKARAMAALSKDGSTVLALSIDTGSFFSKELSFSLGFSTPDRINFFHNLATMVAAGLAISDSLHVLEDQARSSGVKKAIIVIRHDIENGQKLSVGMKKFPRYFPEYLVETVNVGEVTGRLADTLERISHDLERDHELARKVRGAMAYPIVIIAVMVLVVTGLITYVLPKIAGLFTELHATLPLPTRILLGTGVIVERYPLWLLAGLAGLIAAVWLIRRNPKGHYGIHYAFLKVPIFGELLREFNLARFFRALESLFTSGISLVRSVGIAKKILKNEVYRKALESMHNPLTHGAPLSEVLEPFPFLFPQQTRRIVEVGERTGRLEEIFKRITGYYERALNHKTQMLSSLIEPILILFIAVVVGGIALAIFLPIYQVTNVL